METKTSKLKSHFSLGRTKDAYAILKTFKMGLTKDDKRVIEIAYECLTGKESFYKQLGLDTCAIQKKAYDVLTVYVMFH